MLVAVVTGEAGERIRAWRERFDPEQAARLPPHTTLCYWATVDSTPLERQVRYAFDRPVEVRLGSVHRFENGEGTFYVDVQESAELDRARERLFDGTHVELTGRRTWTWHVTCVRDSRERDLDALSRAADELRLDMPWRIDRVAHLELRQGRYEPLAIWELAPDA